MTIHHDNVFQFSLEDEDDHLARSISFVVSGPVETHVEITEQADGTLRVDLNVLGAGLLGDLRGFFFDLKDVDADTANLSVMGIEGSEDIVGPAEFAEEGVDRVQGDVNMKGSALKQTGKFDVGITFGTEGIGQDDVSSASFILSSESMDLTLDSLDLADLGLRYTSVGDDEGRGGGARRSSA